MFEATGACGQRNERLHNPSPEFSELKTTPNSKVNLMRTLLTKWLSLAITLLLVNEAFCEPLLVGVGKRVITPNPLLPVSGGLGPTAPAREKRGELEARTIVFRSGETTVAFVTLDLLGFPSILCDRVRSQVPQIPATNILIGSSHTHSAPDCYAFPDGSGGHTGDLKYIDSVCKLAAESLQDALSNLKPAELKVATGEAQGQIAYNYYAPDLYDRRMSVLQAVSTDAKVIATVVNYAVHPEVLGAGVGIVSPDLIGPLRDRLESEAGGMGFFVNGLKVG